MSSGPTEQELPQTKRGHVVHGSPRKGFSHPFADTTFGQFFSRAVSGVDTNPNLVHMEAQDLNGGKWEVGTHRCP